ncbi:hypothetical protein CHL67_02440 [Prosthecochloris sp. GSB1]|uniref:hypothetical protein n=1 Tax=Prosthecochloris sp. GSB1 TaxID=281093 RepID=UPI000B8CAC6B|nr:hypothetical protein [Prosthecochloris sp. GSB1]ASQ89930.1 hypothetical protein CHL67_02440 [Prosthecochloris sp. GSB1]
MTKNNSEDRTGQERLPYEQPKMQVVSMEIEERLLGCGKDGAMCSGAPFSPPPSGGGGKPGLPGITPVGKTS